MLSDGFGRNITYLRVSLTDRCNLRCVYCMPQRIAFSPSASLMRDTELFRLMRLFAELGFTKIRLTGGEPTLHPRITEIVRYIAHLPGVFEVSMTTNGTRLEELAGPLAAAGLKRVNISLDAHTQAAFRRITRHGDVNRVWRGIQASERAGLTPIKLNAVVVRGYNDDCITALAKLTLLYPWQVRFIELMPLGEVAEFAQKTYVSEAEMRARITTEFAALEPLDNGASDGEARLYRFKGALGTVGFISSRSAPFCAHCNRVRLTADGVLRLCLLRDEEVDLLTPLRAGALDNDLKHLIAAAIRHKPQGHELHRDTIPVSRGMSQIGG